MAYYDALKSKWFTLTSQTTDAKLAEINAATVTVANGNIDVAASAVVGKLMLAGAYLPLSAFASASTTGNATHDNALVAAKMLIALLTCPNAPAFQMSDLTVFATVKGMMDAILAQETAAPQSTGFTQSVHDALLGLAAVVLPWWQSAGYTSPINSNDLVAAGGLT